MAQLWVLERDAGLRIEVTDAGASWVSCRVPLRDGTRREVLLGYEQLSQYIGGRGYVGATVGRYANRIAGASYADPDGAGRVILDANEGAQQLHGGPAGFNFRHWQLVDARADRVCLALHSPDGDQGFPGAVDARVSYELDGELGVRIELEATTTRTTPMALTNHAYLNLDATHDDCRAHRLRIRAKRFVPVDAQKLPLGPLEPVPPDFNFDEPRRIDRDFLASEQQRRVGGYDHAFLLDAECRSGRLAACELRSGDGRLRAALYTDQPAVQFYSGNFLDGVPRRGGGVYTRHAGLALEPGVPPDAPNHPEWQPWSDCFARPGATWRASIRWVFETARETARETPRETARETAGLEAR